MQLLYDDDRLTPMRVKFSIVSFVALLLPVANLLALPIDRLVVFGDSLSDTGNAYIGTGGAVGAAPDYQNGRFTDGPNTFPSTSAPTGLWIDQFAAKLNLPSPTPFLAGGSNYAVGSAQTGTNAAYDGRSPEAPYVDQQVAFYSATSSASPNSLYVFWAGSNDLLRGNNPLTAVSNISANIATLAAGGAKNFLWVNVPQVGQIPDVTTLGPVVSNILGAEAVAYHLASVEAITQLKAQYGISIISVDAYGLFGDILSNPAAYGFTNTTDPAQGQPNVNPNNYVFWDGLHPTTAAHALVADLAYNDVEAAYAPEPAASSLIMAGFLVLMGTAMAHRRIGLARKK